jgi:HAUS augmin-like complex subunit 6 N-terminus
MKMSIPPTPRPTATGPSNIALFLTNLRLLDFDKKGSWPDITFQTFSTNKALENQKKRIASVEWALFHLFEIWDLEETRNVRLPIPS